MTPQQKWYQNNREKARERARLHARKPEARERAKLWQKQNPARVAAIKKRGRAEHPDRVKADQLRRLYGISLAEYQVMMTEQGGKCAICRLSPATDVDHCHQTNKVRGILCNNCNRGLGFFKDSRVRLLVAALYLQGVK